MKCWWTMPIPAWIASRAEREGDRLAVDADLAGVRLVEAVEDVHQGRLAGAVLAEEGVNLAALHLEGDAVVRDHAGELLADVPHREDEIVGLVLLMMEEKKERAGSWPALSVARVGSTSAVVGRAGRRRLEGHFGDDLRLVQVHQRLSPGWPSPPDS